MSKFDVKQDQPSVKTVEEFDALLEGYRLKNPEKYAAKLASGELERFRATLAGGKKAPAGDQGKPLEDLNKAELKALAEEKGLKLSGAENKAELLELLQSA